MTVSQFDPHPGPTMPDIAGETERAQWLDFGCLLLVLVGSFNIIDGIAAIRNSKYLTHQVLFSNIHAWGWFFLIWGIIQIFAGIAVFRGKTWAIWLAVATAFVNALSHLSAARTYPVWSIMIIVIDVLIMYGLVVRTGRRSEA